jgi:hypothetical protein
MQNEKIIVSYTYERYFENFEMQRNLVDNINQVIGAMEFYIGNNDTTLNLESFVKKLEALRDQATELGTSITDGRMHPE